MKKLKLSFFNFLFVVFLVILFALALGVLLTSCSGLSERAVRGHLAGAVEAILPQVSSPLLAELGIDPYGSTITITNGSPLYCRIIIYGEEVAKLGPGDVGYNRRHFEPLNPQIPTFALCYRDAAMTRYIGATNQVFYITGGYPISFSWTIQTYGIQTPEGQYLSPLVWPQQASNLATKKIEFTREFWNAAAGVQIVNNTLFSLDIAVEGRTRVRLHTGDVYYLSVRSLVADVGRQMTVQMIFTDKGRLVGTYDYYFYVPIQGIYAYQILVGPYYIRR